MTTLRLLAIGWIMHVKIYSRSAFDGLLAIVYPLFLATTIFFIYGQSASDQQVVAAAVGAAAMGVWIAVSTSAATALQRERYKGTLELLVAAPTRFSLLIAPMTLAMATFGLYSFITTLVWGRVLFGIRISFAEPAAFVVGSIVLSIGIGMIGFVLAMAAVRYRSAWALGTGMDVPVFLACGFVVPLALLPNWVGPISWVLPPTWGAAAVREAALGGTPWPDIAMCLAVSCVYAVIGAALAERLLKSARTHATLALS